MTFETWMAVSDEDTIEVAGYGTVTIRELPRGLQVEADRLRSRVKDDGSEESERAAAAFLKFILKHGMVDPKFTDEELDQLVTEGSKKRLERIMYGIVQLSVQMRPEHITEQEVQEAERRFPE